MFLQRVFVFALVIALGACDRSQNREGSWVPRLTPKDLDGYTLVTRIPTVHLFKYSFYRDVSLLFYPIPSDVDMVEFTFKAHEEKMNMVGGPCVPQDVEVHLKYGGFPVVNPANSTFPEDYITGEARGKILSVQFKSDDSNNSLTIRNPTAGDWFGAAFVSWSDPKSDHISQQGIVAVCDTQLYTDLRITKVNVSIIHCDENITITLNNTGLSSPNKDVYKCFINYESTNMFMNLSVIIYCDTCQWVKLVISGQSLPNSANTLYQCYFNVKETAVEDLQLPYINDPFSWHYLEITYEDSEISMSNLTKCPKISPKNNENETKVYNVVELVRDTKIEYFTFEYNLPPNFNDHNPTLINMTSGNVTTLKFNIYPVQDIGGTLSIGATFKLDVKYYMGYKRKMLKDSDYIFSENDQFVKVVVCAGPDKAFTPNSNGTCERNNILLPATIIINSTDSESVSNIVHIPFPEIGTWYMSLAVFCDKETVCPCRTVRDQNITNYLVPANETEPITEETNVRIGAEKCNASVVFSVSSAPCLGGKCGLNGMCNFYMSGGFIFSSCRCKGGYAGWDCSDTSNRIPPKVIILSILFLTLSNLLFIPSVVFAVKRKYYTEALVYLFTMLFSTFYHACDVVDANYSFCIVRLGVLQYCDFFCGLLSFWVTLVAMASLNNKAVSLLHMFGAIMIAFGTEMDKQALLVFLIPVIVGISIVMTAWMLRCRKTRKLFPAKAYLVIYLPIGLLLASIGLICFAFLQTNANYYIVHSVWHMIIALSVLCLLPNRVYFIPHSSYSHSINVTNEETLSPDTGSIPPEQVIQ